MSYKAVVFDVDGTLASSNQLIFDSFNFIAIKYLGKTFSKEEIIAFFGPTEDTIINLLFGKFSQKAKDDYYRYYEDRHSESVKLYDGIHNILDQLRKRNILLGIFTGKGRRAAEITLSKLNIWHYFDMIVSGDDVAKPKPDAEGLLKFLSRFRLQADQALFVGDSSADILAARSAGIKIVSVVWDAYDEEKVLTMDPDAIFPTVKELSSYLLENAPNW
jgi:HAD superfamily hydrolase (TIGR01509 family)